MDIYNLASVPVRPQLENTMRVHDELLDEIMDDLTAFDGWERPCTAILEYTPWKDLQVTQEPLRRPVINASSCNVDLSPKKKKPLKKSKPPPSPPQSSEDPSSHKTKSKPPVASTDIEKKQPMVKLKKSASQPALPQPDRIAKVAKAMNIARTSEKRRKTAKISEKPKPFPEAEMILRNQMPTSKAVMPLLPLYRMRQRNLLTINDSSSSVNEEVQPEEEPAAKGFGFPGAKFEASSRPVYLHNFAATKYLRSQNRSKKSASKLEPISHEQRVNGQLKNDIMHMLSWSQKVRQHNKAAAQNTQLLLEMASCRIDQRSKIGA